MKLMELGPLAPKNEVTSQIILIPLLIVGFALLMALGGKEFAWRVMQSCDKSSLGLALL